MTVYVDDAYLLYGRMKMCHMMADSATELHQMAQTIGLQIGWFQEDHYDVSVGKRKEAILAGAVEVTVNDMVSIRRRIQKYKHLQEELKEWQQLAGRFASLANRLAWTMLGRDITSNEHDLANEVIDEVSEYLVFDESEES